ncbi:hypothetical protein BDP27DRAFT_1418872 [Rhodocollybia butyracea]|uniref:Myb/SANT-like domain-containing protein n=1 Tax=Rhodocollybia butyracea TaxID=206335 RepID=A0A9P5PYC4_9AGAR|nr:hypothetical protein BDP27DRAFT_1418872 [Rhodocollybia butyracea]
MVRGADSANWDDPDDTRAVVDFFSSAENRGKLGQGGNPTSAGLEECAKFMAETRPVTKGSPKTGPKIGTRWKVIKSIHKAILGAKQKTYPGISGWNYDDKHGFGVTEVNEDAWKSFSAQHSIFKPFKTRGWDLFDKVHDILPPTARGNSICPEFEGQDSPQASQAFESEQNRSSPSRSPTPAPETPATGRVLPSSQIFGPPIMTPGQSVASVSSRTPGSLTTPTLALKRAGPGLDPDDFESPWSGSKRTKLTGPEALNNISRSIDNVGNAIRESLPAPKQSSAVSPAKKAGIARDLARKDRDAGIITSADFTRLLLLFLEKPSASDAYMHALDDERGDIAYALLNPNSLYF